MITGTVNRDEDGETWFRPDAGTAPVRVYPPERDGLTTPDADGSLPLCVLHPGRPPQVRRPKPEEVVEAEAERQKWRTITRATSEFTAPVGPRLAATDRRPAEIRRAVRDGIVYPFTYLALPLSEPERRAFVPHDDFRHHSGRISLTIETTGPFFTWEAGHEDDQGARAGEALGPLTINGNLAIPGSTIKGLARSIHELMNASCLRVIDEDATVSRRVDLKGHSRHDKAHTEAFRIDVSLVGEGTEEELVYRAVPASHVKLPVTADPPHDLSTYCDGDEVSFGIESTGRGQRAKRWANLTKNDLEGRLQLGDVSEDGDKRHQHVFYGLKDKQEDNWFVVSAEVVDAYNLAIQPAVDRDAGCGEELLVMRGEKVLPCGSDPTWGHRRPRHYLAHDDLVWGTLRDNRIVALAPAQVHRAVGETRRIRQALPEAFAPCEAGLAVPTAAEPMDTDPIGCPSCRVFGMIAGSGERDDYAIAGHVRFDPAIGPTKADIRLQRIELPALMSPKPSFGAFYTKPTDRPGSPDWLAEAPEIAGRKLYWHHDRPSPRGDNEAANAHASTVDAVPRGVSFNTTVRFDNLDAEAIGSLLIALQPSLLGGRFAAANHKLGMGKPVGLGTVKVTIDAVTLVDRHPRYRDLSYVGDPVDLDGDRMSELITAGRDAVERRLGGEADILLDDLAAVLGPATTAGRDVGYPRGRGQDGHEWFGRHRSEPLARPGQVAAGYGQSRP